MGQFDKENAFIVLVARGTLGTEERTKFEELLSAELEWDYVFAQMKRHKLFPLFASHLQSCGITKNLESVLNEVKNNCAERVRRSRILDTELCLLAKSLAEIDITYAVLKGPILAHAIYDNPVKRTYADIDIMVKKSDADAVSNILKKQGYIQGQFDKEKEEIVPTPRKDVLWCSMYIHQLYPFRKIVDQCQCTVEVQTEFFPQYRKAGQHIFNINLSATSECWRTLGMIEVSGRLISTFDWKYFLLQLCLHAYVDEVSLSTIRYKNGTYLRAYCDIREILTSKRDKINLEEFVELVHKTGTDKPIYYLLDNLSNIYGDMLEIVSPVLEQIRPSDLSFMNEFGHSWETLGKQRGQFSQPFLKRLFDSSCKEDYERQRHLFGDIPRLSTFSLSRQQ